MFENYSIVFIDIQGRLAELMYDREGLFASLEILAQMAKILDINIIWCQQNPSALGPTIPRLARHFENLIPIDKFCFSCCGHPDFINSLKSSNTKHAILCGIESHICVYQTSKDLINMNIDVTIVSDAVSSRTSDNKNIAIDKMRKIGANISSVEMLMFELLETAEHPKFRELARLIK